MPRPRVPPPRRRQAMAKSRRQYSRAPRVEDTKVAERFTAIVDVMAGRISVTEAAERLGLSRLRFQSMSHRALEAMIDELQPKAPGRPKRSAEEQKLEAENRRLRDQLDRVLRQQHRRDQMLEALADALRPKKRAAPASGKRSARHPKSTSTTPPEPTPETSSDDDDPQRRLALAQELRAVSVPASAVAAVSGVSS